jgi:hypothetical protein
MRVPDVRTTMGEAMTVRPSTHHDGHHVCTSPLCGCSGTDDECACIERGGVCVICEAPLTRTCLACGTATPVRWGQQGHLCSVCEVA